MDKFSAWIYSVIAHELHKQAAEEYNSLPAGIAAADYDALAQLGGYEKGNRLWTKDKPGGGKQMWTPEEYNTQLAKFKKDYGDQSPADAVGTEFYKRYRTVPQAGSEGIKDALEAQLRRSKETLMNDLSLNQGRPGANTARYKQDVADWQARLDLYNAEYAQSLIDAHNIDSGLSDALLTGRLSAPGWDVPGHDFAGTAMEGWKKYNESMEKLPWYDRTAASMWGGGANDPSAMRVNPKEMERAEARFKELAAKAKYPSMWTGNPVDYGHMDFRSMTPEERREFGSLYKAVSEMRKWKDYTDHVQGVQRAAGKGVLSGLSGFDLGQRDQMLASQAFTSDIPDIDKDNRRNMAAMYLGAAGGAGLRAAGTMAVAPSLPAYMTQGGLGNNIGQNWMGYFLAPSMSLRHGAENLFAAGNALYNPNDGSMLSDAANGLVNITADFSPAAAATGEAALSPALVKVQKGVAAANKAVASKLPGGAKMAAWFAAHPQIAASMQNTELVGLIAAGELSYAAGDAYIDKTLSGQSMFSGIVSRVKGDEFTSRYNAMAHGQQQQAIEEKVIMDQVANKLKDVQNPTNEDIDKARETVIAEFTNDMYNRKVTAVVNDPRNDTPEKKLNAKIAAIDKLVNSRACHMPDQIWTDREIPIEKRLGWARNYLINQGLATAGKAYMAKFMSGPDDVKADMMNKLMDAAAENPRVQKAFGGALTALIQESQVSGNNLGSVLEGLSAKGNNAPGMPGFMDIARRMPQSTVTNALWKGVENASVGQVNTMIATFSGMTGNDPNKPSIFDEWQALKEGTATCIRRKVGDGRFTGKYARSAELMQLSGGFSRLPKELQAAVYEGMKNMDEKLFAESFMEGRSAEDVISMVGTSKGTEMLDALPEDKRNAIINACTAKGKGIVMDWWKKHPGKTNVIVSLWASMNGHDKLAEFAKNPVAFYGTIIGALGIGAMAIGALTADDDDEEEEEDDYNGAAYNEKKVRAALRARADAQFQ